MIYVLGFAALFLFARRVHRLQRLRSIAERPYRFQSDVRRSRWSHRSGF